MKLFLVSALLLWTAIPSLCQTAPQHSIDPDQIFQMPKQFPLASRDLSKPPFPQAPLKFRFLTRAIRPGQAARIGDPHLDAEIIHRPPQESFAAQQPHTPPVGNLYPTLKLLPVETALLNANPSEELKTIH